MFSLQAEDFYDVAKPLHVCSQLLGLTSFTIKKVRRNFLAYSSNWNIFCVTFSTIWSSVFAVWFLLNVDELWKMNRIFISKIFETSMTCIIFVLLVTSVLANWWIFFSQKHFPLMLNLLVEVDDELTKMKLPDDVKRQHRITLWFVISVNTFIVIAVGLSELVRKHTDAFGTNFFLLITITLSLEHSIFIIFQFIYLMSSVKLRYNKINLFLKRNFLNSPIDDVMDGSEKLNLVASMHDKLTDVSESINRCYGVPVS